MSDIEVTLDKAEIGEFLKSATVAAMVAEAVGMVAEQVETYSVEKEAGVGGQAGSLVLVDTYTTDRAAGSVTIAHPAGTALQAKHGSLTKAAAAHGLTVRTQKVGIGK